MNHQKDRESFCLNDRNYARLSARQLLAILQIGLEEDQDSIIDNKKETKNEEMV